jgi:hypothetical protein
MGFISPRMPDFDLDEWRARPHHRRLEPLVKDWALNGFGTPEAIYLLYLVKLVVFTGGAIVVIASTPGVGAIGDFSTWWTEPIAYQKFVVWTLLWEILGLGCGSMPLTFRFLPPVGGFLYWLRPGTMRLPPWPRVIPLTSGTRRSIVDVALYLAVMCAAIALLLTGEAQGAAFDTLPTSGIWVLLGCLAALGLRDKAPFLAARPEHYAVMLIVFLFPPTNMIFALKLCMLAMWWGAATSKLNKHFPFVVSVMISNAPLVRWKWIKHKLWRSYPDDLRPSRLTAMAAHLATVVEFGVPLVLILSRGGTLTTIAVTVMVLFHLHITSTFPLGVPLEWNIFFIYSTIYLFGHYAAVGPDTLTSTWLVVVLVVLLAGLPILGNLRPDLVSFLPSMRYYAGNWAASVWLFRNDGAEETFDAALTGPAPVVVKQLARIYDDELAELLLSKGLAFRAMHSHGRALNGLLTRAVDDLADYTPREGELVAGVALGWNFGDGHLHGAQLLEAVQERCHFASGELRVITLESQPFLRPIQRYRILDAADGPMEEGTVRVADMVDRQPWLSADDVTIPVDVDWTAARPTTPTSRVPPPATTLPRRRPMPGPGRPHAATAPEPT